MSAGAAAPDQRGGPGVTLRRIGTRAAIAMAAVLVCWTLRSHRVNPDGQAFQRKFESIAPAAGVFATHDELLEFVVHAKIWQWTHARWGWDVARTYQVLSCLAGGAFVLLLLAYGDEVFRGDSGALAALVLTGGFVQLFFGDVENYTLTAGALMAYFVAAERFLQAKTSIVWPSIALAVAAMFHLLAMILGPSLLYLWIVAIRRGERGRVIAAGALAAAIVVFTFTAAQIFWGLPIQAFWSSHIAGNGGHYGDVLARPSIVHIGSQLSLLFLLCPAAALVVPLAAMRLIPITPRNVHLILASACMLLFLLAWLPALGPREDWNLFANVAIPFSLLVWTNALSRPIRLRHGGLLIAVLGLAMAVQTYGFWIWRNHGGTGLY